MVNIMGNFTLNTSAGIGISSTGSRSSITGTGSGTGSGIDIAGTQNSSPQKSYPNKGMIEKNAKEYTSYLMSTFAKTMLETCKREDESIDQEIMGTAFLGDALGDAMVESGAGDFIQNDLLTSMMEMQALPPQAQSSPLSLNPITGDGNLNPITGDGSLNPITGDGYASP